MKKCPFCFEDIQDTAKKCRHCGEWLNVKEKNIVSNIEKESNDISSEYIIKLYTPVWKFILYSVISLGIYHIYYLNNIRWLLQKRNKIQIHTGWKKFLGFNQGVSIKLIQGINELLNEKGINKKISSSIILVFYWLCFFLWAISVVDLNKTTTLKTVYIFSFFLSLTLIPIVNAINGYSIKKIGFIKKDLNSGEIISIIIGIIIMFSSIHN